jgi:hypothetical protein
LRVRTEVKPRQDPQEPKWGRFIQYAKQRVYASHFGLIMYE